jgi:hypothetical protein
LLLDRDGQGLLTSDQQASGLSLLWQKGKPAAVLTVKSLVRDHTRVPASVSYSFCRTADCEVVYFSPQAVFKKADLKVQVGIKETSDPIPLCYCFDYSREDVRRAIESAGSTTILEEIKAEVQAGFAPAKSRTPAELAA